MNKLVVVLMASLMSVVSFAHEAGKVSSAKVVELSAHRIDKLVVLGKIDAGFIKKLSLIHI